MIERKYVESLTGLRGFAAVFVMLYHYRLYILTGGRLQTALEHGYLGVDLFFVLSGFVMSMTYRDMFVDKYKIRQHLYFLGLRLARLYPIYAIVTIATIIVRIVVHGFSAAGSPREIICNALLIQNWGLSRSIVGPAWSISVEWALYLLFPFLAVLVLLRRPRWGALLGIMSVVSLFALAFLPESIVRISRYKGPMDIVNPFEPGALIRGISEFILGMLAWRISQTSVANTIRYRNWPAIFAFLILTVSLCVNNADVFVVTVFPAVLILISEPSTLAARILSSRPVLWSGDISYSLYLLHQLAGDLSTSLLKHVIHLTGSHVFIWYAVALSTAFCAANCSYRYIEKPSRKRLRTLIESGGWLRVQPEPNLLMTRK
jgi:peptidoglycan/LPS O-acetylase OafA/YrhL